MEYIQGKRDQGHGMWNLNDHVNLLPTPAARDWKSPQASPATLERNARPLNEVVYAMPTPTASDSKASGAAGYSTRSGRHSGTTLTDVVTGAAPAGRAGKLNPLFCEWMMGLPIGWTDCGFSGTESCLG